MYLPRFLDSPVEFSDGRKKRICWPRLVEEHFNVIGVPDTAGQRIPIRCGGRTLRGRVVEMKVANQ